MKTKNRLVAVLEIGSTGIRLLVAEIQESNKWREIDKAGKPIALGRDVFTSGKVSRASFLECLAVLQKIKELLGSWDIKHKDIYVFATSALRAAKNRDIFVDRVHRETGFRIAIIEGIEENRLMYLAVRFALKQDLQEFWQANTMIIDIGGGSTEIMLLKEGKMVAAHSLRTGTILINKQANFSLGSAQSQNRYLKEIVRNAKGLLNVEMDIAYVKFCVMTGADIQYTSQLIGKKINDHCRVIERERLINFVKKIQHYSTETCMQEFNISFSEAESFVSGLMTYRQFLEQTSAEQILVPIVSIREGFLLDLALGIETELQEDFISQIIASAVTLGRKYHFDEAHGRTVADLCLILFDSLTLEHGMSFRERIMLEVAAILHDIGIFISEAKHEHHGRYIVEHSEIFGLHRDEVEIISNVIGYHRGKPLSENDLHYATIQKEDRILVLKMASILRVADSLDRGHSQQIKHITVEKKSETIVIRTHGNLDISLELMGLEEKADMFQDVYGYKIVLT